MANSSLIVLPLERINHHEVGGKAKGLAKLTELGLKVPKGFVILNSSAQELKINEQIMSYYTTFIGNKPVAVRSSAIDEDGKSYSGAGQYATFLNIRGTKALEDSIKKCFESVKLERVQQYKANLSQSEEKRIAVIVQEMVEAKAAGVLFTRDPQTGKKVVVINAVEGLGDKLVSGTVQGEQYVLDFTGKEIKYFGSEEKKLLSATQLQQLVQEALKAEEYFGYPLDMEWAIDRTGQIVWLQARPITTVENIDLNELDTPAFADHFYTRANVGEMLPGAVTPLSISVFAEAIDIGLYWMYKKVGAANKKERLRYVCNFYNHLFFDITNMYQIISYVLGASKESFELNIFGRIVEETEGHISPHKPFLLRLINGLKYGIFVNGHNKALRKLKKLNKNFAIHGDTPLELYDDINAKLDDLFKGYFYHYQVSANSGAMNSALTAFLGNGEFNEEALAKAALLLSDINDIESANILQSLEEIAEVIMSDEKLHNNFLALSSEDEQLAWLMSPASKQAGKLFTTFLQRHGHRCIREAELREQEWASDPKQPLRTIISLVKTPKTKFEVKAPDIKKVCRELNISGIKKKLFLQIYEKAKAGMRNRELSKSLIIKVQSHFRRAYKQLGEKLTESKVLPDPDLIYFLTHSEIGELLKANKKELVSRAQKRRKLFSQQKLLNFPELSYGKPEPLPDQEIDVEAKKVLSGVPVSRGKAKGRAHIVRSIEDAEQLEPEEIMVAEFTDIGWSPYYSRIAGLVTEIGGSLSHGAIVAREYGLPLVSGIKNATKIIKNGQMLLIDGDKGIVKLLDQ